MYITALITEPRFGLSSVIVTPDMGAAVLKIECSIGLNFLTELLNSFTPDSGKSYNWAIIAETPDILS